MAAISCIVSPVTSVSRVGATAMLAIGSGTTLTVATPLRDPAAAVISAVPSACAVTSPDADTDATVDADEDHATDCPERMFPLEIGRASCREGGEGGAAGGAAN